MPILSTMNYVAGLLQGLPMPGQGTPPMASYIIPPDPNVETDIPTAYVWPDPGQDGVESRDGPVGTMPRNTGIGTPSGDKCIVHQVDVFIVWMGSGDDPQTGPVWLGIIDAVMRALRTAFPSVILVSDPWTSEETQLAGPGEKMYYKTFMSALADQAYNRFDALIKMPLPEVISA